MLGFIWNARACSVYCFIDRHSLYPPMEIAMYKVVTNDIEHNQMEFQQL